MRIQKKKVKLSCIKAAPRTPKGDHFMLDVATARARILENIPFCGQETTPLTQACGRVLAQDLPARRANPPVGVSAMDGYAARAADTNPGAVLRVVGEAPAGHPSGQTVQTGECVRIFTGSQIPDGADTIIIQENVVREGDRITLSQPGKPGQFIRARGQDFDRGDVLVRAGRRLGARDIGLAAAGGHVWLPTARRPRVGVLATGDEITLPGDPIAEDGVFNSAAFMVSAFLDQAGAEAIMLPVARDNTASLAQSLAHARQMDMLVTIGGASVGTYDLVRSALDEVGLALDFWKIAMRPGKPLLSGRLGNTPVIGLPGNPVAAFVCSVVFVVPAIQAMMGMHVSPQPQTEAAILASAVRENDERQDFLRATLCEDPQGGLPRVTPFARQDSAQLNILAQSQALVLRPPHAPAQDAGTMCHMIRLG
ncbi:molybdopterin molybdotransferase MoeA [Acetobacter sp. TBRC 12305]|uniref:Molybdopterin molybdenumtransferase n=1 Tax=Acetobacter garciniae TaxID=2817435 RepID=A0A939KPK7_9PROT|nr:gephyrin-like molybdotransferase Glp [Acetobacter garciniae]MBO1324084.1 molybdopterin molybdotransferase MoeA [Acetobacter garciniae]MBX0343773.1 molybdopterin molybdotransferase MoeA [Acetobacter garciniae]